MRHFRPASRDGGNLAAMGLIGSKFPAKTRLPEGKEFGYHGWGEATLPPHLTQTQRAGRNIPKMIAFEAATGEIWGFSDESSQTVRI
jgi:hypothetical protein